MQTLTYHRSMPLEIEIEFGGVTLIETRLELWQGEQGVFLGNGATWEPQPLRFAVPPAEHSDHRPRILRCLYTGESIFPAESLVLTLRGLQNGHTSGTATRRHETFAPGLLYAFDVELVEAV